MLRDDRRALEGLPFRLLITSLIIALSAPALYGSLSYLQFTAGFHAALEEAKEVKDAALSTFVGGPGNVRNVDIALAASKGAAQIRLAGEEGGASSYLIEVLWKGGTTATVRLEEPMVSIVSKDGTPIMLDGNMTLRLECIEGGNGPVILAEVV